MDLRDLQRQRWHAERRSDSPGPADDDDGWGDWGVSDEAAQPPAASPEGSCDCRVCAVTRQIGRSLPGEVCWNRPCDICFDHISNAADGADAPFGFMCSAGGCHRFHLRCALDGLVRLQGCPICRHPQGHRATIAQDVVDTLEERRVAANLPRPLPAPVTLDDWDIDEMLAATGCPLPPQGVQARCCFRNVAWAPLAERSRPDAAPTG